MEKSNRNSNTAPKGIWHHRDLLMQFTLRNMELKHKGSALGFMWSIISPLLLLVLYVGVFGFIFGGAFHVIPNETPMDYALGVFLGLSIFHYLAEVIGIAPTLIITNPSLVKKVVFPLEILSIAQVFAATFHLAISLVLIVLGIIFFGHGLSWTVLWLPVFILPVSLLALGISWAASALGVFFRDLTQVTQFGTMVLMFSSAIFYPASRIPEQAAGIMKLNPLLLVVEMSRNTLLWGISVPMRDLLYVYTSCGVIAYLGYRIFLKTKSAFADVI
jgi:lipopolysaccharide transport system permease protein